MKVKTWNNGSFSKSGVGYGISIPKGSREKFFNKDWSSVIIHIDNTEVVIILNNTFWTTCNELRSKEIGKFLIGKGLAEWEKGKPHELNLKVCTYREFKLEI